MPRLPAGTGAAISSGGSAVCGMAGSCQTTMGQASGNSLPSHPAAALNGSFHRFGCLRRDGPNPPPLASGKQSSGLFSHPPHPANSASTCAWLIGISPSFTAGQAVMALADQAQWRGAGFVATMIRPRFDGKITVAPARPWPVPQPVPQAWLPLAAPSQGR